MAAHTSESKKRSSNVDGMPRDGLTGMGFHTQRHFIEVREKMNGYLAKQLDQEYDQVQRYPHDHHDRRLLEHHDRHPLEHHNRHPPNLALLDGKRETKPLPLPSHPTKPEKSLGHGAVHTPKSDHRHRKPIPRPGDKR
jgi:hypothetical protein